MSMTAGAEVFAAVESSAVTATLMEAALVPAGAPLPGEPISEKARENLVMEHLPMVRFVARSVQEKLPQHVELDELMSAGMLGLLDAVNKFDRTKQVQFKSYAQFRVRGAILDSLREVDWSPRELRRKGRAIAHSVHVLTARLGRAPMDTEIATEMGMNLQAYQALTGDLKGLEIGSLHAERTEDSGDEEIVYIPAPITDDPLFQYMQGQTREHLVKAIDGLPEKERLVLTLYYYEELTMKEIGLTLGVVESRVSQVHSAAVARLRAAMGVTRPAPAARNAFTRVQ